MAWAVLTNNKVQLEAHWYSRITTKKSRALWEVVPKFQSKIFKGGGAVWNTWFCSCFIRQFLFLFRKESNLQTFLWGQKGSDRSELSWQSISRNLRHIEYTNPIGILAHPLRFGFMEPISADCVSFRWWRTPQSSSSDVRWLDFFFREINNLNKKNALPGLKKPWSPALWAFLNPPLKNDRSRAPPCGKPQKTSKQPKNLPSTPRDESRF